jgi:exodeoxyribonuclease V alpha subunit
VHKSQGSEFTHAALVIPPVWSPVLTRELVYTGITRASRWCSLVLAGARGQQVLETAVQRRVQRASGLLADA